MTQTLNKSEISQIKSPLRWAGGKRFIAQPIQDVLKNTDSNDTLIEVFAGSLSLSFAIKPKRIIANDILLPLINFFKMIKSGEVSNINDHINTENTFNNYIVNRDEFNLINRSGTPSSPTAASLFYYLNRTCFNGLCRFSKKSGFNVGWGKLKNPTLVSDFSAHREVLESAEIHNLSFSDFICTEKGLYIIDPPYHGNFTGYSKDGFTLVQQMHLAAMYADNNNPIIAFNSSHSDIINIYMECGYDVYTYTAPRKISCDGNRVPAIEMIATRNIDERLMLSLFSRFDINKVNQRC